ncbi:coenzyme Q-binding protein COQ10 homolog, mitochondrial [Eucyclogobius newberryi]|uniref:coenzyme Q-binding protein COQ10 homolog, mitochondrial n=1 Tax=Eucyclogobius newberryi TaxID=166745 RepID=UPI003B5B0090
MAVGSNRRLLTKLLICSETLFSPAAHNSRKTRSRLLGCCGSRRWSSRSTPPPAPLAPTVTPSRGFIDLAASVSPRRMEYSESRTFGFSPEQIYAVVANVDQYSQFVPWCQKSRTATTANGRVLAELVIGFPPVSERYVSELACVPNCHVRAVCRDGSLFRHLETVWSFSPGAAPNSCHVDFFVSFEFKSLLHSQLARVFFEEVSREMVSAFESRAAALYRNSPTTSQKPS